MAEEREKTNQLYDLMVKKGYSLESAKQAVDDVLEARREAREFEMQRYIGKRVKAEFGGLWFDVLVHDIKIDFEGKTQFQVTPLNGGKNMVWVKNIAQ
jgi:hypothetical protein